MLTVAIIAIVATIIAIIMSNCHAIMPIDQYDHRGIVADADSCFVQLLSLLVLFITHASLCSAELTHNNVCAQLVTLRLFL
jgi:hypothetical protein